MKKIAIFTMGTRGDVQPYIYLAKKLINNGYLVSIGTHPYWSKLVMQSGIKFIPVGPDINIEFEASLIRGKYKNPMISMLKTMKFVFNIIEKSSNEIYEACKGNDLIIISHSLMGATEAEVLNIPTVCVTLQTEMIPEIKKEKNIKDIILSSLINPQMVKPYNIIRKKYGLNKLKSMNDLMCNNINLIPISKHVINQNPYWDDNNKIVGYWYLDENNYEPNSRLKQFLSSGTKPIILALGAMSFESVEEKEKLDIFINAFRQTNKRAIIQGFNKTIENYELPNNIIHVDSIDHSWLFKQGWCIIHHCGFGTSAATMIYGTPSIPIPHVLDQFSFAKKLYELGVSVKPINAKELCVEKLVESINSLDNNYDYLYNNAVILADKIKKENGLETAVEFINEAIYNNSLNR